MPRITNKFRQQPQYFHWRKDSLPPVDNSESLTMFCYRQFFFYYFYFMLRERFRRAFAEIKSDLSRPRGAVPSREAEPRGLWMTPANQPVAGSPAPPRLEPRCRRWEQWATLPCPSKGRTIAGRTVLTLPAPPRPAPPCLQILLALPRRSRAAWLCSVACGLRHAAHWRQRCEAGRRLR